MYDFIYPRLGQNLLTKLLAGETLRITRVMVGSGKLPPGTNRENITDLVQPEAAATSTIPVVNGTNCSFIVEYRNDLNGGLVTGFWLNEYAVFANDPDIGEVPIYYGTLGDYPQYVAPFDGETIDVRRFPVSIELTTALNVALNYPAMAFMTADSVAAYFQTVIQPVTVNVSAAYNQANAAYNRANAAYSQANAAYNQANNAYNAANNAYSRANTAYNQANNAYNAANNAYTRANNAYNQANSAYNQANAAYNAANNASSRANSAYNQANAAYNLAANAGSNINSAAMNTSINAAYSRANAAYNQANAAYNAANNAGMNLNINPVRLGAGSSAGSGGAAVGINAKTSNYDSVAVGPNAYSNNTLYGVAIGRNSYASSSDSGYGIIAIGGFSYAYGEGAIGIGFQSNASWNGCIAIGRSSLASDWNNATALGTSAQAQGNASTSIGTGAQVSSSEAHTMQLGSATNLSTLRSRVSLTVTSDERDKADIAVITNGLDFITRVQPIQFVSNPRLSYIPDDAELSDEEREKKRQYGMCSYDRAEHAAGSKKGERKRVGVSAQQVQAALAAVYGTADYANIVNDNLYDAENVPEDVENQLTVAYTELIPFLISAIQELNSRVIELEEILSA